MFGGLELAAGMQGDHASKEDRYVMFLTAGYRRGIWALDISPVCCCGMASNGDG
jgi:hypothetical protein